MRTLTPQPPSPPGGTRALTPQPPSPPGGTRALVPRALVPSAEEGGSEELLLLAPPSSDGTSGEGGRGGEGLPTLLLHGFMGTGKTTVGRRVAERAGVPFVDLDDVVAAQAGRPVPEIFAAEGEAAFRRREAEALDRELAGPPGRVVALGGGALLDPARRRAALAKARVVTLTARPETIEARTAGPGRPLLGAAEGRLGRVRALLDTRREAYAEAHARVATDSLSIDDAAGEVLAAWARPAIAVPLGLRSYAVRFAAREPEVAAAAVAALVPSAVFVVTDETVQQLWGGTLETALAAQGVAPRATVVLPPGEAHKRLASVERALVAMVEAGADRDAVVVGMGGGVVTDVAGFTAAVLLRGVRWAAVPTTLLGMVDASVGGKTGVDLGPAKNAVGAFHQPSAVVVDVAHVTTETPRAYVSGLAEVVKSAAVGDPGLFELLEREPDRVLGRDLGLVEEIALRAVAVKAAIVARDERESGDRALLNFGHTVGHALEAEGGFSRLTHGEAVALGMVAALRVGEALGVTGPALGRRVTALLTRLGLPVDLDGQPLQEALRFVALDKKRRGGALRFVVLHGLGDARVHEIATPLLAVLLPGRGGAASL
jgi:shikimate kinase/3-dehydroquinate synthase